MSTLATLVVKLIADTTDLAEGLDSSAKKTGSFMESITGNVQALGTAALAGLGGLAAGAIAAGAAALSIGNDFDAALDGIAIKTGATGETLAGLEEDFRRTFANTPASMEDTSAAIAELNRRLNLSGEPLQMLSGQMLDLSRMLETDVTQNAQLFSRAIGDWGIPMEDSSKALDMFFIASQQTGIGVDSLMQKVVQFGSPLRLMGFTLEESTALFGKWEQEGVNAELVMGSLRIAAGQFSREGVPLREGLLQTIDTIKSTEDSSKALAVAMDIFGARAGPDMAAAIREGRFELGDLLTVLDNSEGAIANAAKQTDGFAETFQRLKNRALLAIEPVGTGLLDLADKVLVTLMPAFDVLAAFIAGPFVEAFSAVLEKGTALLDLISWTVENGGNLEMVIRNVVDQIMEWVGINDTARESIWEVINAVQDFIAPIVEWIGKNVELQDVLIALGIAIASVVPALGGIVATAAPVIATALLLIAAVAAIRAAWESDFLGIQTFVTGILDGLRQFWAEHGEAITAKAREIWEAVLQIFEVWKGQVERLFEAFRLAFEGDWRGFGEKLREWWDEAWRLIKEIGQKTWDAIRKFFTETDWGAVGQAIIDGIVSALTNGVSAIAEAAKKAAQAALDAAKGFLGISSPSKAFRFLGEMSVEGFMLPFEKADMGPIEDAMRRVAGAADAEAVTQVDSSRVMNITINTEQATDSILRDLLVVGAMV